MQFQFFRFLLWRMVQFLPVVAMATLTIFGLIQLVPGDPAATIAGEYATAENIEAIRHSLGLDRPLWEQYGVWLWNAAQGDLSNSLLSGLPVMDEVLRRLPSTLTIAVLALCIAVIVGVPLGVLAATRADTMLDRLVTGIASLGVAVPNFWLGMILVSVFALGFGWFPTTGARPISEDFWGALHHAALPAATLATGGIAEIARQLRSSLIEVLQSQYVRTLRAKGLPNYLILWKHGLRNAALTLLTVIGLVFNHMLGATVATEAVFAIPGTGSMIVNAAINKDFPVVQGAVFVLVLIVIVMNLIIDLFYSLLDPRVKKG